MFLVPVKYNKCMHACGYVQLHVHTCACIRRCSVGMMYVRTISSLPEEPVVKYLSVHHGSISLTEHQKFRQPKGERKAVS